MSTLGTKATIAGVAVLCFLGLSLFAYGISNMSYASAVSNSCIAILGHLHRSGWHVHTDDGFVSAYALRVTYARASFKDDSRA